MVPCYSFHLLQKRHRTLVTVVIMCALIVMVTTISWGVPTLQARFLPAKVDETPLSLPDSEDTLHIPVAITKGATIRPSANRSVLENGGTVVDRENDNAAVLGRL